MLIITVFLLLAACWFLGTLLTPIFVAVGFVYMLYLILQSIIAAI